MSSTASRSRPWLAAVGAAVLVAGCAAPSSPWVCTPSGSPSEVRVVAVAPAAAGSSGSSVRLSPAVGGLLAVQRAESGRSPTGLVQARLALANCGLQSLVVRLRTQFLDAQGWPSEPVSAWREVIVAPRTEFAIDERSTQPGSVAFRVELDRAEVASRP